MSRWRWAILGASLAAAGCVHGYGACLFMQPVKHTLSGKVQFRTYPADQGVDNVPVLVLDKTAYLYAPAQSLMCQSADELQLVGVSEFPQNVVENSHVSAEGKLFSAASAHDHTRFLMNVITLLPDIPNRSQPEEQNR
ncbi:MAG: hypothetical protein ABSD02_02110 [Steroidobacteraceae bacterium]|jgi:hypothetical protein